LEKKRKKEKNIDERFIEASVVNKAFSDPAVLEGMRRSEVIGRG
jgi:hypothetical protein